MPKWFKIILTGFIVSLFFFPVTFRFLPISNTKNLLAGVGIICMGYFLLKKKELCLPPELIFLLLFSVSVSIVALFSIVYNQTPDTTYVFYIRSVVIWLSAAFGVCVIIWLTHGRIDVPLIINYLAGACVFQCVMAMAIQYVPAVQIFVDTIVEQDQEVLKKMNRIYGFGASLDVGGSRFAAVLPGLAFLMVQPKKYRDETSQVWLVLAFIIITIVGNMIARTTIIGVIVGILYITLVEGRNIALRNKDPEYNSPFLAWVSVLIFVIPFATILYYTNEQFYDLMRFGFEGFFSLFETGEFETGSTSALETMIVWPEELRTWIIGDGYFANQRNDANYIGDATTEGFYMGTDIGYLRFIFYFGIIGLITISATMMYAGMISVKSFPRYTHVFVMGILCNFIIWFKVSTDLFPYLALFACLTFLTKDIEFITGNNEHEKGLDEPDPSSFI